MGDDKQIVLHIGRAKSGTSTLQAYLNHYRDTLATHGICYPRTGCHGGIAHHEIARLCRGASEGDRALRAMRDEFETEIRRFDQVIISSEGFQNVRSLGNTAFFFRRSASQSFGGLLNTKGRGPYRVKVICYLREFLEFASSSYAQKVHANAYGDSLERYCLTHFRRPLKSLVKLWQAFADEAEFLHYDRARLREQDIVADFFAQAGLRQPGPSNGSDANPSISGNLLTFKLLLNRAGRHTRDLYGALSDLARADLRYRGPLFIDDAFAARLRAQDYGYNIQLADLLGPIARRSFEYGNRFDPASWREDLDRFLQHPGLTHLKDCPEIYRSTEDQVARFTAN